MKKYAIYIRVSTTKQGASGLGLEAQQKICGDYVESQNGEIVREFKDVESGTHRDRPGLLAAVDFCKENGCTLVIAKLDRLARDIEFTFRILNTGIAIHFCDMPQMNTLILGMFATVAQYERELTSKRTREALAAKRKQGFKLGNKKGVDLTKQQRASAISRKATAIANPSNMAIWQILLQYSQDGKTPKAADFVKAAETISAMGIKTSTGKEITISRLRSAWYNGLKTRGLVKDKRSKKLA